MLKKKFGENFFFNKGGFEEYDERGENGDLSDEEYSCTKCNKILFTDSSKAINFLKNKNKLAEIITEKLNKRKKWK